MSDRHDSIVDLEFDSAGLLPAIAQDYDSKRVLMLGYANREAVDRTRETGVAHYYSRSRQELWKKGGTSGHIQEIREIRVDCDADTLLYLVDQEGWACHKGYESCFYRTIEGDVIDDPVFDPDDIYDE